MIFDVSHPEVQSVIEHAPAEDIGTGDVTSRLCVDADLAATGKMIARQEMTLAGVELLEPIFERVAHGTGIFILLRRPSGARLRPGDEIALVRGTARALLTGERTALNFIQRLSGVATLAAALVKAVEGTNCRILDTRKTTPGLRRLEKMAVAAGGAVNHRFGLFDAVLIKNNHISTAGGVGAALDRTRDCGLKVEIEVRTRQELDEALACGAKHLLLDNLTPAEAKDWIAHIAGRATTELSGGITLATARAYAEGGADFLSSGSITHSAPAVDINFRIDLV